MGNGMDASLYHLLSLSSENTYTTVIHIWGVVFISTFQHFNISTFQQRMVDLKPYRSFHLHRGIALIIYR
eukprot:COSAG06_NODE_3840_length_4849_cov_10.784000_1_plen_70_part_00